MATQSQHADGLRSEGYYHIRTRLADKLSDQDLTDLLSMVLEYGDEQESLGWRRGRDDALDESF